MQQALIIESRNYQIAMKVDFEIVEWRHQIVNHYSGFEAGSRAFRTIVRKVESFPYPLVIECIRSHRHLIAKRITHCACI